MPEGVLSPFLSRLSSQLLLSQAWPVQSRAELSASFSALTLPALPGSLLKGILAYSSRPGVWFRQQQNLSWQIKGSRAPELQCTRHLYLLRHSPRLWWGRRRRGGENGGQAAAFMYLYIDVSHQRERWTDSPQWSHQSALFNTPGQHTAKHRKMDKRGHYCGCWHIFINIVFSWFCQME